MFADNHQISSRQAGKLAAMYLFGMSSLFIPQMLSKRAGRDGVLSLLLAVFALTAYFGILLFLIKKMKGGYMAFLEETSGKFIADVTAVFYYVQFLIFGAFAVRTIGELIGKTLLPNEEAYTKVVMIVILLISAFSCMRSLEERGRLSEVLFGFVFIPLVIMLVLAAKDTNIDYLAPLLTTSSNKIFVGAYEVIVIFSIFTVLLFMLEHTKDKKKAFRSIMHTSFWIFGANLIIYTLCIGTFGAKGMKSVEMPVVRLMTSTKVPGSFLERWDPFLIMIWILCMFSFVSACLFYGNQILSKLLSKENSHIFLLPGVLLIYSIAVTMPEYERLYEVYQSYMYYVGAPLLFGIPVAVLLISFIRKKGR